MLNTRTAPGVRSLRGIHAGDCRNTMVVRGTTKAPGTMALVLGSNRPILGNSASAGLYELPFTSRRIEVVYKLY
jgi:hypothetical protein